MRTNEIYKKNDTLYRILYLGEKVLVIDCVKRTMPYYVDVDFLNDSVLINEDELLVTTGICIKNELSDKEKSEALLKRASISLILPVVHDVDKRNEAIDVSSKVYKVSKKTIRNRLCNYLAFMSLSIFVPNQKVARDLSDDERNFRWVLNKYFYNAYKLNLNKTYEILLKEKYSDFDICICNAGIMLPKKELRSKQGRSLTLDTNFVGLAHFLKQIVPLYKNKRYVLQGSLAASINIPKKDILNPSRRLFNQYNTSKAGVESLFYYYFLNNKDNEFILTEPGVSSTDLFNGVIFPANVIGRTVFKVIVHKPNKASLSLVKATSKSSKNGDYLVPRGLGTISGYPKYKKLRRKQYKNYSKTIEKTLELVEKYL